FGRGCKDTNFSIRERGVSPLSPEKKRFFSVPCYFLQKLHFLIELTFSVKCLTRKNNTFQRKKCWELSSRTARSTWIKI
ncbi:MAG: hypothetical protein IJ605_07320, partial [Prevotella sp.]|nr:hypothetical protein [Prevotella sp.]